MFARFGRRDIRTIADLGDGVLPSCRPACGFSAVQMRAPHDAAQPRDGQPRCMDAIDQVMALASAMLLMVLAGLAKSRLEWRRRPPFWWRWRR